MLSEALVSELQNLSPAEKLRVVQMLINQLAQEEAGKNDVTYEIWSPFDAADAAAVLQQMLAEEQA